MKLLDSNMRQAITTYEEVTGELFLDKFFCQLHLFTSVSQVAPYALKMLKAISTPFHIKTLFELMLSSNKTNQILVLKIISNMIANKVPMQVFTQAIGDPFDFLKRHSLVDP